MAANRSEARRSATRELVVAGALYAAAVVVASVLARRGLPQPALVAAALLPALPAALMLRAAVRSLRANDELQLRIKLESLAIAVGVMFMATVAYGLLERYAGWPAVSILWAWPVVGIAWAVVTPFVARRFR